MKMIDINSYLGVCRYSHPSFSGSGNGIISDFISLNSDLSDIIEVCTTEVYPQCLKFNGNEVLIWDHTFWMLYERFIHGIWHFNSSDSSMDDLSIFLETVQNLFLSLRFSKYPALSYFFAQEFNKKNSTMPGLQLFPKKEDNGVFRQLYDLAQWQVFFHELRHYYYRKDKKLFLNESGIVSSLFKLNDSAISDFIKDNKGNRDVFLESYHFFANIQNNDMIEEICCDIFAIVDYINSQKIYEEQNKNEIFTAYISTIRYVIELQSIFTYVERIWIIISRLFADMKKNRDYMRDFSSITNDVNHLINARAGIVFDFASRILNVDSSALIPNELFESEFYSKAISKSYSIFTDYQELGAISVYLNEISEKFTPTQLRSARDLLIGWY